MKTVNIYRKIGFKFTLLFGIIILLVSCSNNKSQHIGEWKATNGIAELGMILDNENNAVLYFGNEVIGGNNFVVNGVKTELKYEINYEKDPIWLDLIMYKYDEEEEIRRIKGIIRFISKNKMQYKMNMDISSKRDESFDIEYGEETFVLDRVLNK